jgi:hypothetical protein
LVAQGIGSVDRKTRRIIFWREKTRRIRISAHQFHELIRPYIVQDHRRYTSSVEQFLSVAIDGVDQFWCAHSHIMGLAFSNSQE